MKRLLLFGLLGATLAACAWVRYVPEDAPDGLVAAEPSKPAKLPNAELPKLEQQDVATLALDNMQRSAMTVGELNPFNAKSWYVAPPPAPQPLPAKPSAPPLPFTYIGKFEEEGRWIVYLTKGEQFYTVTKGETFDQDYRLDGVENGNLVIQYLPLSVKQLLAVGVES